MNIPHCSSTRDLCFKLISASLSEFYYLIVTYYERTLYCHCRVDLYGTEGVSESRLARLQCCFGVNVCFLLLLIYFCTLSLCNSCSILL